MVQAVQLMTQCPDRVLRKVLDIFHTTAVEVCVSQQMDMDFEKETMFPSRSISNGRA